MSDSHAEPCIPVVLCIDAEPDPRHVSRIAAEPWDGYVRTVEYFQAWRGWAEDITHAAAQYCWCFRADPQIAEAYGSAGHGFERYPKELAAITAEGDAIGAHVHPYRWLERTGQWLQDFGDPGWVEHCVHSSLSAAARATGRRCEIVRFGDRWQSTAAMNVLREAGVRIDLTIEPGLPAGAPWVQPGEPVSGSFEGFATVPREPYTPRPDDFQMAAAPGPFCALPMTSAAMLPDWSCGWRERLRRLVGRAGTVEMPLSMWRRWREPNTFGEMITRAVAAQRRPYLAFAIRTDFGVRRDVFESVERCLETLLAHPLRRRFRFCTPDQALRLLGWPVTDHALPSQWDRISRRSAFLRSRKYRETGVAKSPESFSA